MEKSQVHIGQTVELANGRRASVVGIMTTEQPPPTILVRFFSDESQPKSVWRPASPYSAIALPMALDTARSQTADVQYLAWAHPGDLTLVQTD